MMEAKLIKEVTKSEWEKIRASIPVKFKLTYTVTLSDTVVIALPDATLYDVGYAEGWIDSLLQAKCG